VTKPASLWRGRAALLAGHCAGMVDLVALPVWIGALVGFYGFDPQQSGGLATLFLAGAVLASIVCASLFHSMRGRLVATVGFAAAAMAFLALAFTSDFREMALLHALAGMAVGCAASATHGTMGRSAHPHRLFAFAGLALGIFAVAFLAVVPPLVERFGGQVVFIAFAAVMSCAALIALLLFPPPEMPLPPATESAGASPIDRRIWFVIAGISIMSLNQAMIFGFIQRIGIDRGFGVPAVQGVLIALGLVNLIPAPMAAALERRLDGRTVVVAGPIVQALNILLMTQTDGFASYAFAAATFVVPMIFTHTFAFGMLARIDRSGRATAATAAMVMIGAASGPLIAGTLVKNFGYASLGISGVLIAVAAVTCFSRVQSHRSIGPGRVLPE
jgi:predicted MFS family arabinose efflux permease